MIHISIQEQRLRLLQGDQALLDCAISTARNGPGEENGSGCTPRGWHRIRIKIGEGCPAGTVFIGRRPTGEVYSSDLAAANPQRDWILTRILWLSGMEPGRNRGGMRDSLRRFIYIHGTPASESMGLARSHGCIRMRDADLLYLFERVRAGDPVLIEA
ncbi:MAG: L,D-transpeptidase [Gammaproteobacteria bacterium SHHR-1]